MSDSTANKVHNGDPGVGRHRNDAPRNRLTLAGNWLNTAMFFFGYGVGALAGGIGAILGATYAMLKFGGCV